MAGLTHEWRKSSFSGANGSCVEVRLAVGESAVVLRDSTDPSGSRLQFPLESWQIFVRHATQQYRMSDVGRSDQ